MNTLNTANEQELCVKMRLFLYYRQHRADLVGPGLEDECRAGHSADRVNAACQTHSINGEPGLAQSAPQTGRAAAC